MSRKQNPLDGTKMNESGNVTMAIVTDGYSLLEPVCVSTRRQLESASARSQRGVPAWGVHYWQILLWPPPPQKAPKSHSL